MRDRCDAVDEDERGHGLEVEEDPVEDTAPKVLGAEVAEERVPVDQHEHARDLDGQGGNARVELKLGGAEGENDLYRLIFINE